MKRRSPEEGLVICGRRGRGGKGGHRRRGSSFAAARGQSPHQQHRLWVKGSVARLVGALQQHWLLGGWLPRHLPHGPRHLRHALWRIGRRRHQGGHHAPCRHLRPPAGHRLCLAPPPQGQFGMFT
jgi:hypothetical protein